MLGDDLDLIEHPLHIACDTDALLSKAGEDAGQVVGHVRSLHELAVQGVSLKLSTSIKHYSQLLFSLAVHTVMGDIPHLSIIVA